ncbi:MAG: bifunctional aspartate kinase/homoserine dehydrogenase I [Bacteroidaceae bacterium]|nr:bifunctional aspartate kinase/homoserine dehydrogenase I [Bacteroidaceae bacterium]
MKVLKFGGSSVGSVTGLHNIKKIAESSDQPLIIVVSALGGITDKLIALGKRAATGDIAYIGDLDAIIRRHLDLVKTEIAEDKQAALMADLESLFHDLRSILHGVCLIQDLTQKTADAIVAFGERLSSLIVATFIDGAKHYDSRTLFKTTRQGEKHLVDYDLTNKKILDQFTSHQGIAVMGGFIATDATTGATTNLGRGGSDFTAAIIAAALDAEALEIWTDVDGFMTADPRVISTAYTIDELTYGEAMELCNFGAKVVYPPTIYPVCVKNIPILIKNTLNPTAKGSIIHSKAASSKSPIRGISSVNEMSLVTVSGLSMVGVVGVNRRIFATLAKGGISVFMVAQTSSETSTSLCVTTQDADKACQLLDKEFEKEIQDGAMHHTSKQDGLATVAVVGERMKQCSGTAGKLFTVLGKNGISISAMSQGALEMNISFVVEKHQLRKALNVLHDSFFLSQHEELNVFLCGTGTVGGSLLEQLAAQRQMLMEERGLKVNLVGVCGRTKAAFCREGIDPARYKEILAESGKEGGVERMVDEILEMNIFNSVFVDCTASEEVAAQYGRLLSANVSVVAANKVAASSNYDNYEHLKLLARERGVKYLFETNVGAGLPIINTINDLRASGDKILRIEAVLSGTLNFVFNTLSEDIPLSKAVQMAKEAGYSEPDPRIDLSGKDVIRKITILARESGYRVEADEMEKQLFIPASLFEGSLDEFWAGLPALDAQFEAERKRLVSENKRWRFVAEWADGKGKVSLREIPLGHPFYDLEGSNNIILLNTERYREYPMLIQGYGAGAAVTAAGVFADVLRVANI